MGGQYEDDRGLSNISLRWILESARAHGLRIAPYVEDFPPNPFGVLHDSYSAWTSRGRKTLREVPENAWIHASAALRSFNKQRDKAPEYKPENVVVLEGRVRIQRPFH